MTEHDETGESRPAWEVLDYFLRNPGAADDVIGRARWRRLDERVLGGVAALAVGKPMPREVH